MRRTLSLRRPAFSSLLGASVDLTDWYFYVDVNQEAGPTRLATESPGITINGAEEQPIILLLGQDATTTSWPNRGSLGGSMTAVNIRPEDLNQATPYTDGTKAVRFNSAAGGTRRYYKFDDTSIGDVGTEDLIVEAIFLPEATSSSFDCISVCKFNSTALINDGWRFYATTNTNYQLGVATNTSTTMRVGQVTRTTIAWSHITSYLDNNAGGATFLGSQTSALIGSYLSGTMTNDMPFTVGDSTVAGVYTNTQSVNFRLAYLAVWKRSNWFPGPSTTEDNAALAPQIRKRQTYLAGVVESVSGLVPSTFSVSLQRWSEGYASADSDEIMLHPIGVGCAAPETYALPATGEHVSVLRIGSGSAAQGVTSEDFTNFTSSGTAAAANNLVSSPIQNRINWSAAGIKCTGAAGTGEKYVDRLLQTASTVRLNLTYVFVKAGTASFFYAVVPDTVGGANRTMWVNLGNGSYVLGANADLSGRVDKFTDGWWRVLFCFRNSSSASNINLRYGFSDASGSTSLTSNGSAVDGYLWGHQYTTLASGTEGIPRIPYFYNPSGGTAGNAALIVWPGTVLTSYPISLWYEMMAPYGTQGAFAASTFLMVENGNSANDSNYLIHNNIQSLLSLDFVGNTGGVAQYNIDSGSQTGSNGTAAGDRVRFCGAVTTNSATFYNNAGQNLGTDAEVTPMALPATNIRVNNAANGGQAGLTLFTTRFGVAKVLKTNSSGPPGTGITE